MVELDLALKAFVDVSDSIDKKCSSILNRMDIEPVHLILGASAVGTGQTNPITFALNNVPATGRVWNVRRIALLGSDGHTPVSGINQGTGITNRSQTATGSVTSPGAGATIVQTPSNLTTGVYNVTVTIFYTGTVSATDLNNMSAGGVGSPASTTLGIPGIINVPMTYNYTIAVGSVGGKFAVTAIAAGTAGAIYNATITVTPTGISTGTTNPLAAQVDVYGGQPFDISGGSLADLIISGATIPSITGFSRKEVWLDAQSQLFAIAYNIPANQNLILTARIDEYPVEVVEAMSI